MQLVVGLAGASLALSMLPAAALGGITWKQLAPASHPSARYYAAMAYDPVHHELVLFGGYSDPLSSFLGDTWTWNGSNWTHETPAHSPGARDGAAMLYDQGTGSVLLFGGQNAGTSYADTWTWNGSDWTQLAPVNAPAARAWAGLAPDPVSGDPLLFGGDASSGLADTWTWDGANWNSLSPTHSPSARSDFGMALDTVRHRIVLFGGGYWNPGLVTQFKDTWTWNGTDWTQVATTGPSSRADTQMAFDPRLGRVVLFGGYDYAVADTDLGDSWQWNGSAWSTMAPKAKPSRRDSGVMNYFPPTGNTVLFGGFGPNSTNLADTWVLSLSSATTAPAISTNASATKSFTVQWGAPGAVTGYVVQYAKRVKTSVGWVNGAWQAWKTVSGSTHSAVFTGAPGNTYLFHAKANYAGGATSGYSNPVTAVVPYDDRSSTTSFSGGWSKTSSAGHFLGTITSTSAANKTMTVTTAARSFTVIGDKCAACGKFKVYIDGTLVTTIDSHRTSTATRQILYKKTFSATKTHTLKIKTMGTAGHPKVVIDAVGVQR